MTLLVEYSSPIVHVHAKLMQQPSASACSSHEQRQAQH